MSCINNFNPVLRIKKKKKNPEILIAQELLSIWVHGLDSVLFIMANPELGWAQTLSSVVRQVQRVSGLELGIQIISKNTLHLHFFLLFSRGLTISLLADGTCMDIKGDLL